LAFKFKQKNHFDFIFGYLDSQEQIDGENANENLQFQILSNEFNQNNGRHYDKLLQSFHKSPAGDNRNILSDSFRKGTSMMRKNILFIRFLHLQTLFLESL
jgi:hypothetical protein